MKTKEQLKEIANLVVRESSVEDSILEALQIDLEEYKDLTAEDKFKILNMINWRFNISDPK